MAGSILDILLDICCSDEESHGINLELLGFQVPNYFFSHLADNTRSSSTDNGRYSLRVPSFRASAEV